MGGAGLGAIAAPAEEQAVSSHHRQGHAHPDVENHPCPRPAPFGRKQSCEVSLCVAGLPARDPLDGVHHRGEVLALLQAGSKVLVLLLLFLGGQHLLNAAATV